MGKPNDSDIREGKKTVLTAKAYEWSNNKQKGILNNTIGNRAATEQEIEKVRNVIYEVGAYDYAVSLSHKLIGQAKEVLGDSKLKSEGKEYLMAAADYLLSRM